MELGDDVVSSRKHCCPHFGRIADEELRSETRLTGFFPNLTKAVKGELGEFSGNLLQILKSLMAGSLLGFWLTCMSFCPTPGRVGGRVYPTLDLYSAHMSHLKVNRLFGSEVS